MVTQMLSFTSQIAYDVTIENGVATNCTCPDHTYRRHRACKHMKEMNAQIEAQIEKAARFLAAQREVQTILETARAYREMAWDSRF